MDTRVFQVTVRCSAGVRKGCFVAEDSYTNGRVIRASDIYWRLLTLMSQDYQRRRPTFKVTVSKWMTSSV